tara:strand:- start:622 stop:795 length:174 start_codon:yes stop_codon:yes gene_type:complete
MVVTYNEKKLYVKLIDISGKYVLASYNEGYSKLFKLDIKDLELSKKEILSLTKTNNK